MRYSSPAWFILMLKLTVVCFILKNIPVFAYLQMDMIINYFHDIGFSYSYAVTKKKFADQPAQLQKVVKSINNSLKETKRVHFLVMTKWDFDVS